MTLEEELSWFKDQNDDGEENLNKYREFVGFNQNFKLPNQLIFESDFECGNLDCIVKVAENEYDLYMRVDANTRGHLQWFYF